MQCARTYLPIHNNWQCLCFYILSFGQMKWKHIHVQSLSAYLTLVFYQKSPYCSLIGGFCTSEPLFSNTVCFMMEYPWSGVAYSSSALLDPWMRRSLGFWWEGTKEQRFLSFLLFICLFVCFFTSKIHLRYLCIRP